MSYFPLTAQQQEWKERAADIAQKELAPRAAEVDRNAQYPEESLNALKREGLWALRVSREHGGLEEDLVTTCLVVEEISKKCPSTAMCYKMHLEAAEIVCRIPTPFQVDKFVEPMARGEVFTTVAGGESSGQGADWNPASDSSSVERVPGGYQVDNVRKSFVTSAGKATHYMFRCRVGADTPQTDATLLFVAANEMDVEVVEPWTGLGMRGNNSSPLRFSGFVPEEYRLGSEHKVQDETTGFFRPVLALTYAAAYLGIASGAFEIGVEEAGRVHPSGARRIDAALNQRRMGEMSAQIEAARALLLSAASAFDQGRSPSALPYFQAKVVCAEAATRVTQDLMTMFGGTAFAGRLPFERYFRDARAGVVMGIANDAAYQSMTPILFPPPAPEG